MKKINRIKKNDPEILYLNLIISFNQEYIKKLLKENITYTNILYFAGKRVITLLSFFWGGNLFATEEVGDRVIDSFLLVSFPSVRFDFLFILRAFI